MEALAKSQNELLLNVRKLRGGKDGPESDEPRQPLRARAERVKSEPKKPPPPRPTLATKWHRGTRRIASFVCPYLLFFSSGDHRIVWPLCEPTRGQVATRCACGNVATKSGNVAAPKLFFLLMQEKRAIGCGNIATLVVGHVATGWLDRC